MQVHERDRDIRLKQILVEIAKLEGDAATSGASIHRLESDLEQRRIVAPITQGAWPNARRCGRARISAKDSNWA